MKDLMSTGFFFIQKGAFYYTVFQGSTEGFNGCGSRQDTGRKKIDGHRWKIYPTEITNKRHNGTKSAPAARGRPGRDPEWESKYIGASLSRRPKREKAPKSSCRHNGYICKITNNYRRIY